MSDAQATSPPKTYGQRYNEILSMKYIDIRNLATLIYKKPGPDGRPSNEDLVEYQVSLENRAFTRQSVLNHEIWLQRDPTGARLVPDDPNNPNAIPQFTQGQETAPTTQQQPNGVQNTMSMPPPPPGYAPPPQYAQPPPPPQAPQGYAPPPQQQYPQPQQIPPPPLPPQQAAQIPQQQQQDQSPPAPAGRRRAKGGATAPPPVEAQQQLPMAPPPQQGYQQPPPPQMQQYAAPPPPPQGYAAPPPGYTAPPPPQGSYPPPPQAAQPPMQQGGPVFDLKPILERMDGLGALVNSVGQKQAGDSAGLATLHAKVDALSADVAGLLVALNHMYIGSPSGQNLQKFAEAQKAPPHDLNTFRGYLGQYVPRPQ